MYKQYAKLNFIIYRLSQLCLSLRWIDIRFTRQWNIIRFERKLQYSHALSTKYTRTKYFFDISILPADCLFVYRFDRIFFQAKSVHIDEFTWMFHHPLLPVYNLSIGSILLYRNFSITYYFRYFKNSWYIFSPYDVLVSVLHYM